MAVVKKDNQNLNIIDPASLSRAQVPQAAQANLGTQKSVADSAQKTQLNNADVKAAAKSAAKNNAGRDNKYKSQYANQLTSILNQITNNPNFKYEFNQDPLFGYYSDLYQKQGQQASADTMGQAAAMTGGYGNSYGASVGNQAYQSWLQKIYDKGLEFRNAARQNYDADLENLYNRYNAYMNADNNAYEQWMGQQQLAQQQAELEAQQAMQQAQLEQAQAQWEAEMKLKREQWDWQVQQAAAAAAAAEAARGGGGGGGGGGNTYYRVGDKYYRRNADGSFTEVPASQVNRQNDRIDPSMQNTLNNLQAGANAVTQGLSNLGNQTTAALGNLFSGLFKKKGE